MKFLVASASLLTCLMMVLAPVSAAAAAADLAPLDLSLTGSQVNAMVQQPDGKMIIAGTFTQILGATRGHVARLNADGTLDTAFDPNANGTVNAVALQPDGKILLGGAFTSLRPNGASTGTTRYYIARVNADGSLDSTFSVMLNADAHAIALQADGKILVGGAFQTVNNLSYDSIARFNADGTLDTPFQPRPAGAVYCIAVQPDGDIVVGGNFPFLAPPEGFNGARRYVARLSPAGLVDSVFDPRANGIVRCVAVQADGKVLLGGEFTTLRPNSPTNTVTRNHIARVNTDGTLDTGFDPGANAPVSSLALQADGRVLMGGEFTTLAPNGASTTTTRNRIARLNTDGRVDSAFDPNANGAVNAVALQADGAALVGGAFTALAPNGGASGTRHFFARLVNDTTTQTLTAAGGNTLTWTRGGAAPELTAVAFEQSVNGGSAWTALGAGTRVAGGWQLTGLSLPSSGMLRARGRTAGGQYAGSTGVIEQVITLPVNVAENAVKSWAAGLGVPAASQGLLDDPDGDGVSNLQEFAFGTGPLNAGGGALEYSGSLAGGGTLTRTGQPAVVGETVGAATQWHALFVRRTDHAASGITYTVSFSGDLGTWEAAATSPTVLADDGSYQIVRLAFPTLVGGLEARFFRVSISTSTAP